jgi:hypothetical protein
MRQFAVGVLLLVAGCAVSDPREDAVLFDSAEERAKRDVFLVYYSESADVVASVVISREGRAELRGEYSQATVQRMRQVGFPMSRRFESQGAMAPAHREAIDLYFAALPAGISKRALSTDPKEMSAEERKRMPPPYCGPETERMHPLPKSTVRVLHLSGTGEVKTLWVFKAASKDLPAGVEVGGATLETIDRMILSIPDSR